MALEAIARWTAFFNTYLHLPLSQYMATIPLQKHELSQGLWPKGFTPALHAYEEMESGEAIKDVLKEVIRKTKSIDFAEYYVRFSLQDFHPNLEDTRTDYEALTVEAKQERNLRIVTDLTEITELVPKCIDFVGFTLMHSQPMESLGSVSLSTEHRMNAITEIANAGSRMAKTIITQADIGDLGGHAFDDLSMRLGIQRVADLSEEEKSNPDAIAKLLKVRFTEAMYNALDGNEGSQEALLSIQTLTQELGYSAVEGFSVIYDYLIQQQRPVLGIDESLVARANEIRLKFSHYFKMTNLLKGKNMLTFNRPVDFKGEL